MRTWPLLAVATLAAAALLAVWWISSADAPATAVVPPGPDATVAGREEPAGPPSGAAGATASAPDDAASGRAGGRTTARRSARAEAASAERGPSATLEGRVLLPAGTPADEEAWVVARSRGEPRRARVQPDGTFAVEVDARATRASLALDARYLYVERASRVDLRDPEPAATVLEPTLGGRLVGRVLPPAGAGGAAALEGVDVDLLGMLPERDMVGFSALPIQLSTEVDANGDFAFDHLDPERVYTLTVDAREFPEVERDGLRVEAGGTTTTDFALDLGVWLAGQVVDESGAPVEGARVRSDREGPYVRVSERSARTDAEGRFELVGVVAGDLVVEVEHDEFQETEHALGDLAAGAEVGDLGIVLERGRGLAGTVVWPDGRPVARAWVSAVCVDERDDLAFNPFDVLRLDGDQRAKTDDDGRFVLPALEGRLYALGAHATPDAELLGLDPEQDRRSRRLRTPPWRARVDRVEVGTQDLRIELTEGLAVTGVVTDDVGEPLERFTVHAHQVVAPGARRPHGEEILWSFRDGSGAYRLTGLSPGTWDVTATAGRHAPAPAQRVQVGENGGRADFSLLRPAVLAGQVVDEAGAPVADAILRVERLVQLDGSGVPDEIRGRADEDGRFTLAGIDPRGVRVVASATQRGDSLPLELTLAPGAARRDVQLVLRSGGTLEGLVREPDGRPSAHRSVTVWGRGTDVRTRAATDARGEFRLEHLPPGTYSVTAELPREAAARLQRAGESIDWREHRRLAPSETVEVVRGETVRVELGGPEQFVAVSGRVTLDGEPVGSATLGFRAAEDGAFSFTARTDAEGRFLQEEGRAGRYRVDALTPRGNFRAQVVVPEVRQHELELDFVGSRITGRVVDAGGRPLQGVHLKATPPGVTWSPGLHRARSADDGSFTLVVPAGTWDVLAGGPRSDAEWSGALRAGLSVAEGETLEGVELRVSSGGALDVELTAAGGSEDLRWGRVRVLAADGSLLHVARAPGRDDGPPHAEIEGLPEGRVLLLGESSSLVSPRPVAVDVRAGERRAVALELARGTELEVEVVAPDGTAVPDADLRVWDANGVERHATGSGGPSVRTSPAVRVRLPAGDFVVEARADGRAVRADVTLAGEDRRLLRLELP